MRFLFVVPPLIGHINPAARVSDELDRQGHQVAWAGDTAVLDRLLRPWTRVYPCATPVAAPRPPGLRGFAALKYLWEQTLVPLATAMLPDVLAAARDFRPDVLVVDQQALAGALAAARLGLPWATSATTSGELTDPLGTMPKVRDWLDEVLRRLRADTATSESGSDLRLSPHLALAYTTAELMGDCGTLPDAVRFVGPVNVAQHWPCLPWQASQPGRPLVLVSLGTANIDAGQRFLAECVAAIRTRPHLTAVVVDPSGVVRGVPNQIVVARTVAQVDVLARASAVVCHAGHNTVCEALSYGLPLVVAPIRDDQPIIAEQVTRAGVGVRLRFDHARTAQVGDALDAVLTEPSYRFNAMRIRDSFRDAGGVAGAARELVALAHGESPHEHQRTNQFQELWQK